MTLRVLFKQLNIVNQCQKYHLSLWQCPQFVFVVMGLVIVASILLTYFIGARFIADPLVVAVIVILITVLLFILDFIVTRSFDRLAEVAKMRADFVSIVSHQLRSPLTNLRWAIDALNLEETQKISKEQLEYLEILRENSERMTSLVSDLLNLTRIEEGRLPARKEAFSLIQLVQEVIREFKPFAQAHNLKLAFKSPKNLPLAFADPRQIRQVVEILLSNALQYTKNKGKIEISLSQPAKEIIFQIKDNGIGIPKESQRYVFQKFFRAENAKEIQTQGSGLGLFIAKSIIQRSGGKIWFESKEGKGTTFWFSLPSKL